MGGEDGNGVNPISKLRPHTCQLQIHKDEEELAKSPELAAIAKAAFEKRAAVSADRKKNNKSGLGNDRGVRKLGQTLTDAKVGPDALVGENTLAFMAVFRFTCEDSPKAVLEWNRTLGKDVPDDKIPPDNNPASDVTIQNDGTNKLGGECWIAALDTAGKQFSRPGGAPKIPWQKFRIVGTVKWETGDSCTKEAVVEYTPSPPKMGKKDPKDQFEQPSDISDPAKGEVKVTYGGGSEKR